MSKYEGHTPPPEFCENFCNAYGAREDVIKLAEQNEKMLSLLKRIYYAGQFVGGDQAYCKALIAEIEGEK